MGYYSKVAIQAITKAIGSVKEYNERTGNAFLPDKIFIRNAVKRGFKYNIYWKNINFTAVSALTLS